MASVHRDFWADTRTIAGRLRDAGVARVGLTMAWPLRSEADAQFLAMLEWQLGQAGIATVRMLPGAADAGDSDGLRWLADPLARDRIEVLVGMNDASFFHLRALDPALARDIGFVSFQTRPASTITGLKILDLELAREGIRRLDQMIRHNEWGLPPNPSKVLLPSRWLAGTTWQPQAI